LSSSETISDGVMVSDMGILSMKAFDYSSVSITKLVLV